MVVAALLAVAVQPQFVSVPWVAQRAQMQLEPVGIGAGGGNGTVLARVWARPVDPACASLGAVPISVAYAWDAPCGANVTAVVVPQNKVVPVAPYSFTVALDGWTQQRVNVTVIVVMSAWCALVDDPTGGVGEESLGVVAVTSGAGLASSSAASGVVVTSVGWKAVARLDGVWYALVAAARNGSSPGSWNRPVWLGQDQQWVSGVVGSAGAMALASGMAAAPPPPYQYPPLLVDLGALAEEAARRGDAEVVLFLQ